MNPLLNLEQARDYLALPPRLTPRAVAQRFARLGVPVLRLGHHRVVRRADLDAVIQRAMEAGR